jgi:cobalt/nickel transport system permease protein
MHIPDGTLDPGMLAMAGAVSVGAVAQSVRALRSGHQRWGLALAGAGAVLGAHLIDVPLHGTYTGHLIGGTLLAIGLGPSSAVVTMTMVLALEALILGDGGLYSLGANVLIMAVVGVLFGYGGYRAVIALSRRLRGQPPKLPVWTHVLAGAVGAWVSVVASALTLAAMEVGGGVTPGAAGTAMTELVPHHFAWGLLEAVVTGAILAVALVWRRRGGALRTASGSAVPVAMERG